MDLAERIAKLSDDQRKRFELKLKQQDIDITGISFWQMFKGQTKREIEPAEKKEYYPLSSAQERLYMLQQMDNDSPAYNMPGFMHLEGTVDKNKLENTFKNLIKRHESLRTSFRIIGNDPVQEIHDNAEFEIEYFDLAPEYPGGTGDTHLSSVLRHRSSEFIRPFDLAHAPLLRVGLIKIEREKHIFMVDMHHVISDGSSLIIFIKEFMAYYGGEELQGLKIQYRDFAQWQSDGLTAGRLKKQEVYWLEHFSGQLPVLNMPIDFARPPVQRFEGDKITFQLEKQLTGELNILMKKTSTTLFMMILSIYTLLLSKYTGQEDIIIGTAVAGRNHRDLENIIGLLMETLVLRNTVGSHKTFEEFLKEVRKNSIKAFDNQEYPFRELMKNITDENDLSRNPLFDTMLIVHTLNMDMGIAALEIGGLRFTPYAFDSNISKVDINLVASEEENSIRFNLQYCTALFKPETMERFSRHFVHCIREVVKYPGITLSNVDIMSEEEKRQILEEFNDTAVEYQEGILTHELFEEQVEKTPDSIALIAFSALTYRGLNEKANQLAHVLKKKGVGPDRIVGILVEPSIDMIVGLMAILKSGAAYLPLGPEYPQDRLQYMLESSNTSLVLVQDTFIKKILFAGEMLNIGSDESFAGIGKNPVNKSKPEDLAYIIYTSGSTGKPKGVMVEHQNLRGYLNSFEREFDILPTDTVIQQASYCFDAFVEEVYPTLLKGGKLVIPRENEIKDIDLLSDFLLRNGVNVIDCSPLLLNELNKVNGETFKYIHTFISGGDVLKGDYICNLLEKGKVYNTYGPTETTVCASYYRCPGVLGATVPIGKPVSNYKIYILDKDDRLSAIGVPGELCICGAGVSRGYLNNPELTAEKFVTSIYMSYRSHKSYKSYKSYRTGDLARWLADGNIEYIGRVDQQVKIRGYRIEPGEIEHQLVQHEDIKEAVVLARDESLRAYIVPVGREKNNFTFTVSGLREYLLRKLPDYMIPSYFIEINEIPLTANGKIDEKALYEYGWDGDIGTGAEYVAPTNEIEEKLAGMWSEILGKDRIGIYDNFFELGGQSILAMRTSAKVQEVFSVKIPLITFFQEGTIRGIAAIISGLQREDKYNERCGKGLKRKGLIQPFDLHNAPLLRTVVLKLRNNRHFFFINIHHIISDGISLDILTDEFVTLYSGGEPGKLPIQYKSFSQWQTNFFQSEQFRKQEEYWLGIFNGKLQRLDLPLDYPRPEVKKDEGKVVHAEVGTELIIRLKRLAAEREVTLFMLFLAAYIILLGKITGQEDIIVGTPVSGRTHAHVLQLVGMFVNTLALRNKPECHLTFYQFLETVKERTLSALENQDYPFEMLVEKLKLSGDAKRNPLFDTLFTVQHFYQHDANKKIKAGGLTFIPYEMGSRSPLVDLVLGAAVSDNDIRLHFNYDIHLFHEATIQQMASQFITILQWVVHAPEQRIDEIDLSVIPQEVLPDARQNQCSETQLSPETLIAQEHLSQHQKEWILHVFNDTQMEYPGEITIHQLFEQQAKIVPHRVALICKDQQLTYEALDRKSDQVAGLLLKRGIAPEDCVGLMVESSLEIMVGIFGILKAGGGYLPIDPRYPREHIRYMVKDASVTILLTQNRFQSRLPFFDKYAACVIPLDELKHGDRHWQKSPAVVRPDQLSYIIYTSGSTGRPKGVVVEHRAVVNRIAWMQKNYPLAASDTLLQKTTITFDVSVAELFGWFLGGARLCFPGPGAAIDYQKLLGIIETRNITAISFTPTVLHSFFLSIGKKDVGKLALLKWIFCAGEQLPESLVETWGSLGMGAGLENLYGPTEATAYASYYSCHPQFCTAPVPIGKPLGNTRLYVLNEGRELMPPGAVGELVLAGASLARGYLNRPGLTGEKFLPDPFFPGDKMYCTGDYAKLLPDGQVVFLGRMDNQVKIKGIRIELEEIESVLFKHPDIREAAVIDRDDPMGKYLAAYIVPQRDVTLKELRAHLSKKLPGYMVPSVFLKIDKMPLTASGKLERKSLDGLGTIIKADVRYIAPRTELERQLGQSWAEILKLDKIGIDDNFFELGGDSLKANMLLARISNRFNVVTAIKDLFDAPTIRKFTQILSLPKAKKYSSITPVEKKEYFPAASAQKRLFILNQLNKDDTGYNLSISMIAEGHLDIGQLKQTIKQLVQRHESLRTGFETRNGEIIQRIGDHTDFEMEFFAGEGWDEKDIERIIKGDIPLSDFPQETRDVEDNLLSTVKLTKVKRKPREI